MHTRSVVEALPQLPLASRNVSFNVKEAGALNLLCIIT